MEHLFIEIGIIYFLLSVFYLMGTGSYAGHHYFDPLVNYEEWDELNMFGVLVFTILLSIVLAPWAIIYWLIKILVALFTIGRR